MPMQAADGCLPASVSRDAAACGDQAALAATGRATAPGGRASEKSSVEQKDPPLQGKHDVAWIPSIDPGHFSNALVVARFLGLCGNPTLDGAALAQCYAMVKFLSHCQYSTEEVCAVLAHTSKYFSDIRSTLGSRLGPTEGGNIMVVQAYIAHCFVIDETCPLSHWHRFLCDRYCNLATLDAAVIQLMKKRNYKLRLDDRELQLRYRVLFVAATAARH